MRVMPLLYHVMRADEAIADPYAPATLAQEGFVHCSFASSWRESARLYFPVGAALKVLEIDPARLACEVRVVATPRGPMPHVHGAIPRAAIVRIFDLGDLS